MKPQSVIQRFIAFLLLLVFSVSIAPKTYFHDAIAKHRDAIACHHPEPASYCLHQQSFNCHFDELVVTAPFLVEDGLHSFAVLVPYQDRSSGYLLAFIERSATPKTSRGPPAV